MRIIGGEWRSRIIAAPPTDLRPTADRTRESVFNILMNIVDFETCTVCDLFAGSGAMGIEALSRGAAHALFVEKNPDAASIIKQNLKTLAAEARGEVITGDAHVYARTTIDRADIVFADPPYDDPQLSSLVEDVLDQNLFKRAFIIEHSSSTVIKSGKHVPWKQREFGTSAVTIFMKENA